MPVFLTADIYVLLCNILINDGLKGFVRKTNKDIMGNLIKSDPLM
jgi:hypothetical protein